MCRGKPPPSRAPPVGNTKLQLNSRVDPLVPYHKPYTTQTALQVLSGGPLEGLVCLCAHTEIMKWLVRGFGQVNWQDRGAPAIKAALKENISQYLWYLGDSFLLFTGQGMLLASVKKAIQSKKIISVGRITASSLHVFLLFPSHFLKSIVADCNFMPARPKEPENHRCPSFLTFFPILCAPGQTSCLPRKQIPCCHCSGVIQMESKEEN